MGSSEKSYIHEKAIEIILEFRIYFRINQKKNAKIWEYRRSSFVPNDKLKNLSSRLVTEEILLKYFEVKMDFKEIFYIPINSELEKLKKGERIYI